MHIEVTGTPQFYIPFTQAHIDLLMKLSATHYDAACRSASADGTTVLDRGFICNWRNQLAMHHEFPTDDDSPYQVSASWRQLDTCLKIMEYLPGLSNNEKFICLKLSILLRRVFDATRDVMDDWKIIVCGNDLKEM